MAIDSSVGPGWDGRAAKMSRSMVPFASLISTGLRLMSELHTSTLQRGPGSGPGPLGRLAGPCARPVGPGLRVGLGLRLGTPVPGRGRRCGRVTGTGSSVTACPASVGPGYRHGPPGARAGRRLGRLQPRRSQPSLGPMANPFPKPDEHVA